MCFRSLWMTKGLWSNMRCDLVTDLNAPNNEEAMLQAGKALNGW